VLAAGAVAAAAAAEAAPNGESLWMILRVGVTLLVAVTGGGNLGKAVGNLLLSFSASFL
jgi:hypothetical protein